MPCTIEVRVEGYIEKCGCEAYPLLDRSIPETIRNDIGLNLMRYTNDFKTSYIKEIE